MNGFMMHCGANEIENRTQLSGIELPPTTRSYCPVGHDTFVDLVQDKLADAGYRFGTEKHALTKEGKRYFGLVELLSGQENEQHALVAGIRNSIDKSFPAAVAFGANVFVCDNLSFTGEIKVSRKHTTNIMRDLPDLVVKAVSQTGLFARNQERRFEFYQDANIRSKTADHLIIEMVRRGAINTSRVEKVVREWDEPSHDFGGRTAWRLFNAATEALKGAPIADMPPRTIALQGLLDDATGFSAEKAMTAEERAVMWEG
jgi:hypothetical protein